MDERTNLKMILTGKDLIKLIKDAGAEDFVVYIGIATDPLGVDYCPLDFDNVTIEDNTIKIT